MGFATEDEVRDQGGMEMVGRMARRAGGLAVVIALLGAGVALAAAGGRGTVTETQHGHNEVFFSESTHNPCTGEPGTILAIAANSVFHVTFFETSDEFWVTGTGEGTVTFTPENPAGIYASGHFTAWFGASSNNKNEVEHNTLTFHLAGSDGSHIAVHSLSHLSTNAKGEVTVSFEKPSARCG
jgi:hypothetical protein